MSHPSQLRRAAGLIVVLALSFSAACAKCADSGKPLLWRIEGTKSSWLFGTIHIPDERVLKLRPSVQSAFDGADAVYAELPMDMGTQMKTAMMSMLPDGKTLEDVLPKDLYERLAKLFKSKKLPMMAMSRFKIWAVAVQVALIDHLMELASKQPLDAFLYNQASQAGKEVGGIEKPKEQLDVFDALTQEEQTQILRDALDEYEKNKKEGIDFVKVLTEIYLKGDEVEMMNKMLEEYDPKDPLESKLMKRLFTDRNERMAERIAKKLKAEPGKSFFFAVGAGHLPGDDGIVTRLRKAGYKVKRVEK